MKMGGTATNVPVGSRTTVQESTQEGLTSGSDGTGYYPSAVAVHTASSNLMNRVAYWTRPTSG